MGKVFLQIGEEKFGEQHADPDAAMLKNYTNNDNWFQRRQGRRNPGILSQLNTTIPQLEGYKSKPFISLIIISN